MQQHFSQSVQRKTQSSSKRKEKKDTHAHSCTHTLTHSSVLIAIYFQFIPNLIIKLWLSLLVIAGGDTAAWTPHTDPSPCCFSACLAWNTLTLSDAAVVKSPVTSPGKMSLGACSGQRCSHMSSHLDSS